MKKMKRCGVCAAPSVGTELWVLGSEWVPLCAACRDLRSEPLKLARRARLTERRRCVAAVEDVLRTARTANEADKILAAIRSGR